MSSWRNLMTPPQERYYISESSPSLEESFGQDKFHHEVSDFTAEVSNRKPVVQSKNFKELRHQLNQLEDDLGRSSIQAKQQKERSTFEKSDFFESTPRITVDAKRKGILRTNSTQEKELYSASTCSGFSRKFLNKEVEVRAFDHSEGKYDNLAYVDVFIGIDLEQSLDEKTPENKINEDTFSSHTRRSSFAVRSLMEINLMGY